MGYAKVTLLGHLTRDVEVRYSQNNKAFATFGVAVNRKLPPDQNGNPREQVMFIDVTIPGARGEAFSKWHKKGSLAFLVGDLVLDQWDDKNTGEKRSRHKVTAWEWEFVGGKREQSDAQPAAQQREWTQEEIEEAPF